MVQTLEVVRIESFIASPPGRWPGRPEKDRRLMARAFVAKAVCGYTTTRALLDAVASSPRLRRICGWERRQDVPSEASFSRAFAQMARSELPQRVHAAMIEVHQRQRLVGHLSRDSAAIAAREKAARKARDAQRVVKPERKRGRPRKGEVRPPKELTRIQRQAAAPDLAAMLAELPRVCDFGCKRNSDGKTQHWKGYKIHVDWADGVIPISCVLSSASLNTHDVRQLSAKLLSNLGTKVRKCREPHESCPAFRQRCVRLEAV